MVKGKMSQSEAEVELRFCAKCEKEDPIAFEGEFAQLSQILCNSGLISPNKIIEIKDEFGI